jgi:hypothetical protein
LLREEDWVKRKAEAEKRRYIQRTEDLLMPDYIELSPPGFCNWCGKPLPKTHRRFCPAVIPNEGSPWEYKVRRCANAYYAFWWTIPRWKRVIFIRDNFTCKACGDRPVTTNPFGIEIPDLGQLAADHIRPVAKGGKTIIPNLQTLCRKCNQEKSDKLEWIPQVRLI